ncbi:MAG: tyrosine-type recombinase/integrase [Candidatus Hydrogenedentes bacterium]|nr:tyrosine-type recombinase/integrase [Candidatus Hydrogenedentota bacterium]
MPRNKITIASIKAFRPRENGYEVADSEVCGLSLRVEPGGSKTWYLRYRLPSGQRARLKIAPADSLTPTEARKRAQNKLSMAAKGIDPRDERKREIPTLGGFIKDHYSPIWLGGRSTQEATIDRLENVFAGFWKTRLNDIRLGDIERHRSKRIQDKKAPSTVNREIVALKSVLNRAVEWGYLDANPLARMKQLKEDRAAKVRYLTAEEEDNLLKALESREGTLRAERVSANDWRRERGYAELLDLRTQTFADTLRPVVLLSLHTGLRRGEVFNLHWEDIDFDRAILTVKGTAAKTKTTRHVPLNSVALDTLRKWREQTGTHGLVFKSDQTGGRLDNLNTSWEGVLEEAQIVGFRWHDMRHHFASKLVMAGVDLNTVRDLLGHTDIKMTLRYAHLAPEVKQKAVELLARPVGEIVPFPKGKMSE